MTTVARPGPTTTGGGPALDLDDYLADIGDRIRAERQARRWSRDELATRAGMNSRTIRNLETGIGTLRSLVRACQGLQVDLAYLLSDRWQFPEQPLLTVRQAEVLRVVADGRPLSVAAPELGMTPEGLASVLSGIYRRLGVADVSRERRRAAAVRVASSHGLFDQKPHGIRTS